MRRRKTARNAWLKSVLATLIFAALAGYLVQHWDDIQSLPKLDFPHLSSIYVICLCRLLIVGKTTQRMLGALAVNTSFWEMVVAHQAICLLNYLPMKAGTVFRAGYLKRRHGLTYSQFCVFSAYMALLQTATATGTGLMGAVALARLERQISPVVIITLAILLACSLLLLFFPVPVPRGTSRFSAGVRAFLIGRKELWRDRRALAVCSLLLAADFLLAAALLGVVYHTMGVPVHPAELVVLEALGIVSMFVGITPGALGVREAVLGGGAMALGIPPQIGLLIAVINRAASMSWCFVVGLPCVLWMWRKCPVGRPSSSRNFDRSRPP